MASTPKEYTKLPGRGARVGGFKLAGASRGVYTLWLGSDHVLLVERNGYVENYRRFYFTDIQAIVMRRTSRFMVTGAITVALALLLFLWGYYVTNLPGRVTLWILAGGFALICLINFLRGPSCVTHIQTAVQREHIASWGRVRDTQKGMAILRPKLLAAQGEMSPDDLKARWMAGLGQQPQSPATGTA